MTSPRAWGLKMVATGRCDKCGKPARTRQHCPDHARRASARAKAYYARVGVEEFKRAARGALKEAIRKGQLTRPTECSRCGITDPKINGHHHDYTKPLDVEWLCYRCHAAVEERGSSAP